MWKPFSVLVVREVYFVTDGYWSIAKYVNMLAEFESGVMSSLDPHLFDLWKQYLTYYIVVL